MINVAVVGCGKIAERHLNAYKNIKNLNIYAICDVNEELVKKIAFRYGVRSYTDYKDLFECPDVDAIDVCIPTSSHHEIVLEALDNGKNVFCEKPLTYKLEYAEEINNKQKKVGKTVMVGYLYRFHPAFQRLKNILNNGIIGDPYFSLLRLGGRGGHRIWKHKKDGGGALLEMMVHTLDIAMMCFGEFNEVRTLFSDIILKTRIVEGKEIKPNVEDYILVRLKSKNGVEVFCEADLITPSYMNSVEVHGNNGSFFGSILHYFPTIVYCKGARGMYDKGRNVFENPFVNLVEKELKYFVASLSEDVEPLNSVEDSIRLLKIIEEIRKQVKSNNL